MHTIFTICNLQLFTHRDAAADEPTCNTQKPLSIAHLSFHSPQGSTSPLPPSALFLPPCCPHAAHAATFPKLPPPLSGTQAFSTYTVTYTHAGPALLHPPGPRQACVRRNRPCPAGARCGGCCRPPQQGPPAPGERQVEVWTQAGSMGAGRP